MWVLVSGSSGKEIFLKTTIKISSSNCEIINTDELQLNKIDSETERALKKIPVLALTLDDCICYCLSRTDLIKFYMVYLPMKYYCSFNW